MVPDFPQPSWVDRYRKFLIAAGGFVLEAGALLQDAHPTIVGAIAFVTTALVVAIRNEQPVELDEDASEAF